METEFVERLTHKLRDPHHCGEVAPFGRIEIQDEMGNAVEPVRVGERRVVFDRALVPEPQERATVITERVRHLAFRRLRPDTNRRHPLRRVLRHVLLHERFLASVHSDHRQWPVFEFRDHPITDRVQIVDQISFGRPRVREQRIVEVREVDPGAGLAAVRAHRPMPRRVMVSLTNVGVSRCINASACASTPTR